MEQNQLSALAERLAERLVKRTTRKGYRFSCAESCTGGLLASKITMVPGASAVFPGSIVSYENAIKHKLLFVPDLVLDTVGAVSAPCALAMAQVCGSRWTRSLPCRSRGSRGRAVRPRQSRSAPFTSAFPRQGTIAPTCGTSRGIGKRFVFNRLSSRYGCF